MLTIKKTAIQESFVIGIILLIHVIVSSDMAERLFSMMKVEQAVGESDPQTINVTGWISDIFGRDYISQRTSEQTEKHYLIHEQM